MGSFRDHTDLLPNVQDTEALDALLMENYTIIAAAHEQQNIGRLADALAYQRRLSANLEAIVGAIRASDLPVAADPTNSAEAEDLATAAADVQRLSVGGGAAAAAAGGALAGGSGVALNAVEAGTAYGFQPQQQQQQHHQRIMQQPPLQVPLQQHPQQQQQPSWLSGVNQSVSGLLGVLGLSEYAPLFESNAVDMAALELLSREDLKELGLPLGAIVKLQAALRQRGGGGGGGGG